MITFFLKAGIAISLWGALAALFLAFGNLLPVTDTAAAIDFLRDYFVSLDFIFPIATIVQVLGAALLFEMFIAAFKVATFVYNRFASL